MPELLWMAGCPAGRTVALLTRLMPAPGGMRSCLIVSTSHKTSVWTVAPHRAGLPLKRKKYAVEGQPKDR